MRCLLICILTFVILCKYIPYCILPFKKSDKFEWVFLRNLNRVRVMVFNVTFNNISAISWWSVLLVEETRVPGKEPALFVKY